MDVRKELQALGFIQVGAIRPIDVGTRKSCMAHVPLAGPEYVVYAFVVGDEIKKFGKTRPGIKNRILSTASALKGIMADPTRPRNDPFKRLAPKVMEANQEIEVWARNSSARTYAYEEQELNLKYKPEWVGRPD
jgi:hypothetical protein